MAWSGTTRAAGVLVAVVLIGATAGGALATTRDRPDENAGPRSSSQAVSATSAKSTAHPAPPQRPSFILPKGAIVVAPGGRDDGAGSLADPLATLRGAIARATRNGTIVLRAGRYHESVTVPEHKPLTIRSYPGEEVWLDGTAAVREWTREGEIWRHDGWTAEFDASPSYHKGAPPSPDKDFQFIDPKRPMAAHPDQVWLDGRRQRQVGSLAEVKPGAFYVDNRADRLYLGSDPSGREVRASALSEAITLRAPDSILRGVRVHGYATSLPQIAAVKVVGDRGRVVDVTVTESATTGLSAVGADITIKNTTTERNGMLGLHANHADGLKIDRLRSLRNNVERFKMAPVAGGVKVTRARGITVTRSLLRRNRGTGLWLDESVYDITIVGNDIVRNAGHGINLELSATAVVADNVVRDNDRDGIRVNNTEDVRIWNNTVRGGARSINIVQDARRAASLSTPGHDPRQKLPDPTVTWVIKNVSVGNNLIADPDPGATCQLCVEDYSQERTAREMGITADGNVYVNRKGAAPRWRFVWSRGPGDPAVYTSVAKFRRETGQERHGVVVESDSTGPSADVPDKAEKAARPLPDTVRKALGGADRPPRAGAWR